MDVSGSLEWPGEFKSKAVPSACKLRTFFTISNNVVELC